jgi:hypothetical protein
VTILLPKVCHPRDVIGNIVCELYEEEPTGPAMRQSHRRGLSTVVLPAFAALRRGRRMARAARPPHVLSSLSGRRVSLRPSLLVAALLGFAACSQPPAVDLRNVRREFSDVLYPRFTISNTGAKGELDLRGILSVLRKEKSGRRPFDAISSITFESSTRARVAFTWSDRMHGGFFALTRKDDAGSVIERLGCCEKAQLAASASSGAHLRRQPKKLTARLTQAALIEVR